MTHEFLGRRKRLTLLFATALVALGVTAGSASAASKVFSNTTALDIPDSGPASVYPSTINVSGFSGNVQNVTATLNRLDHTCLDDLEVLLVGPSGKRSILMSDV